MPRMRAVKPSFFHNVDLLDLSPLHRLAFIGLWCEADREGRLLDRPRQLHHDVLPKDPCDFEAMLADLAERGFLLRYEVGGCRYIQVVNFLKHQRPHPKEAKSDIPPPGAVELPGKDDLFRGEDVSFHGKGEPFHGKGEPFHGKVRESPVDNGDGEWRVENGDGDPLGPAVKPFLAYFEQRFKATFGRGEDFKLDWTGKDIGIASTLLKKHKEPYLRRCVDAFLKLKDDDLLVKNGHTMAMFRTRLPALIERLHKARPVETITERLDREARERACGS